jgi:hypothetical protein
MIIVSIYHVLSHDNVMKAVGVELCGANHSPLPAAFHVLLTVMVQCTM